LLGRQGPLFPPLFPFRGPGMHRAIVMGCFTVTPCPQRGQTVGLRRNTLAFPQHGPEPSKWPVSCPAKRIESADSGVLPNIYLSAKQTRVSAQVCAFSRYPG